MASKSSVSLRLIAPEMRDRDCLMVRTLFFLTALFANAATSIAREDVWREQPYPYIAFDQDIGEVLQEFGQNLGLQIRVSETLEGRVSGNFVKYSAGEFLDFLTQSHGLVWFDDGFSLDFSANNEIENRMLPLGKVTPEQLRLELIELDVADDRFPIRAGSGASMAMVSGPKRFIELVEGTIDSLNRVSQRRIDVFRGLEKSGPPIPADRERLVEQ